MTGGVYVYRTRKPGARFRIPILSYHVAYVGQTSSFWHRHRQHMGKDLNGAKPWADLEPRCYRITLINWKWLRLTVEALLIWTLFPVYNVQRNRANPRRITPMEARRQRRVRDLGGHPLNVTLAHRLVLGALGGAIVGVLVLLISRLVGMR